MEQYWTRWYTPVILVMLGYRIEVQARLGEKQDPISKITKTKRAGGTPQYHQKKKK
jgi:hypothetical protein